MTLPSSKIPTMMRAVVPMGPILRRGLVGGSSARLHADYEMGARVLLGGISAADSGRQRAIAVWVRLVHPAA